MKRVLVVPWSMAPTKSAMVFPPVLGLCDVLVAAVDQNVACERSPAMTPPTIGPAIGTHE